MTSRNVIPYPIQVAWLVSCDISLLVFLSPIKIDNSHVFVKGLIFFYYSFWCFRGWVVIIKEKRKKFVGRFFKGNCGFCLARGKEYIFKKSLERKISGHKKCPWGTGEKGHWQSFVWPGRWYFAGQLYNAVGRKYAVRFFLPGNERLHSWTLWNQ